MAAGVSAYLLYHFLPGLHPAGPVLHSIAVESQPVLIFLMLFLQFCKISPSELTVRPWCLALLLLQGGLFAVAGVIVCLIPEGTVSVLLEAAMLCLICPTAIAAGVITGKIGGSISGIMTYVMLINCLASLMIPAVIPLIHPVEGAGFWETSLAILGKVFPTLIFPAAAAWAVKYLVPRFHAFCLKRVGWAFYLWGLSLAISLLLTTRTIMLSNMPWWILVSIGVVSLVCCLLQFHAGHVIGKRYSEVDRITAGQAFGQKNTSLMIWIGYSYMTPQTAIAGGLYCIWHNLVNSWELERSLRSDIHEDAAFPGKKVVAPAPEVLDKAQGV